MPIMARDRLNIGLLAIAGSGLAAGFALWSADRDALARLAWSMGVIPVLAGLIAEIIGSLARREVGFDIVAALSMSAALIFGEALAAAVVALMYAGGTFLESFAQGRARREMSDLLSRVARTATLQRDGGLLTVPLDDIVPGDLLMIRRDEVAPVDGTLASDQAVLDQSALTGESLPVRLTRGATVLSGATNAGDAFDLCATHRAADSTYAGIVRLIRAAQASRAPMTRMADRFSLVFLVVTVVLASAACRLTGDPIRAVAVLVVATPCPLILAVPVAQAVVAAAQTQGAVLPVPTNMVETPGAGVTGLVDGHAVVVGGTDFVAARTGVAAWDMARPEPGAVVVAVAVDGQAAGWLVMADALRPGIAALLSALHRHGIGRIVLATGDHRSVAMAVAKGLALDAVHADLTPARKVQLILSERANGPVMMVDDGVNDAPALAAVDVGVAMGARGAAASAEAADVVLLVDRLDRLLPGLLVPGPGTGRGAARGHRCRRDSECVARPKAWHE